MNEPIISPLFIYLLSLVDIVIFLLIFTIVFVSIYIFIFSISTGCYDKDDRILCKKLIIFLLIVVLLAIFIPSRKTLLSMLIAEQITTENIDKAKELIQSNVEYIIDTIK